MKQHDFSIRHGGRVVASKVMSSPDARDATFDPNQPGVLVDKRGSRG